MQNESLHLYDPVYFETCEDVRFYILKILRLNGIVIKPEVSKNSPISQPNLNIKNLPKNIEEDLVLQINAILNVMPFFQLQNLVNKAKILDTEISFFQLQNLIDLTIKLNTALQKFISKKRITLVTDYSTKIKQCKTINDLVDYVCSIVLDLPTEKLNSRIKVIIMAFIQNEIKQFV